MATQTSSFFPLLMINMYRNVLHMKSARILCAKTNKKTQSKNCFPSDSPKAINIFLECIEIENRVRSIFRQNLNLLFFLPQKSMRMVYKIEIFPLFFLIGNDEF